MSKFDYLKKLSEVDIRTVKKEELIDIGEIELDASLPQEQKVQKFIDAVKNPYCFRVGDIGVQIAYSDAELTFADTFFAILKREKTGL